MADADDDHASRRLDGRLRDEQSYDERRFRRVVDAALDELCERAGLGFDACSLLSRLRDLADWRTGIVPGSRRYLAERLRISPKKLTRLLDKLADAKLIATDFRRGHEGEVVVLVFAELLKLTASQAEAVREAQLPERRERPGETPETPGVSARMTRATRAGAHVPERRESDCPDDASTCPDDASDCPDDASDQGAPSTSASGDESFRERDARATGDWLLDAFSDSEPERAASKPCDSCGERRASRLWRTTGSSAVPVGIVTRYCDLCEPSGDAEPISEWEGAER